MTSNNNHTEFTVKVFGRKYSQKSPKEDPDSANDVGMII